MGQVKRVKHAGRSTTVRSDEAWEEMHIHAGLTRYQHWWLGGAFPRLAGGRRRRA
jgi:hypothetical protein